MKQFLCAAAAIALLLPAAASAQRHDNRHNGNQTQQHGRAAHQRGQNRSSRHNGAGRTTQVRRTTRVARPAGRQTRIVRTTTYRIGHRPTTFHRIRTSGFRYPRGYRYRRWNIGSLLPRLFLSSAYYWNDYGALGLGPPPPGYVWVRYGPDLLLVNRYNGRVADVIYGAFY